MNNYIKRFVCNYTICYRTLALYNKKPGLLQLLLILYTLWTNLFMDFKDMLKDKNRFDAMLVIVDRLSKQVVIIPCFQTVISYDLASIFITYIY
jgi:hypothetical protein